MASLLPRACLPLAGAMLLLAACGTAPYEVTVDSLAKPKGAAEVQSYKIRSKDPTLGEESLRYREAAEFVRTALSGKGLYEAPSTEKADMIVELDYGLDAPKTKMEQVKVPVYAEVGGRVRYDTVPIADGRGNTTVRTVAVYEPPRSELIGYEERVRPITIYEKYLKLTARENKPASEGRPPSELWSVHVSAEDESKDLRKYLPVMASASIDYIGKDSENQQVVRIQGDSPAVEFVRRGMSDGSTKVAVQSSVGPKS